MTTSVFSDAPASLRRAERRLTPLPLAASAVLVYLAAITIFGKGPTYLPFPPVFWGELTLGFSLLWLIQRRGLVRAFVPRIDWTTLFVAVFISLGAIRMTFSMWAGFHLDVIRDSAVWYYGCFYFVGTYIGQNPMAERFWRALAGCWAVALVWGTADLLSGSELSRLGPVLPWRGEPLISNSTNELVQHMALGALIVANPELHRNRLRRWAVALVPVGLVACGLIAVSRGRGAKVGLAAGLAAMLALAMAPGRPIRLSRQVLMGALLLTAAVGIGVSAFGDQFLTYSQLDRFLEADPSAPKGTAYWRMLWWQRLAEAVRSQNVLFGLGFGESLNVYNPFLHGDENSAWPVRSPHNVSMTIFSRMGWVGVGVWFLLLLTLLGRLFRAVWSGSWRGQSYSPELREELAFWLVMILATLGNSSFGVLMEGPVLGVWFWFAAGFATGRTVLCRPAG